MICCLEKLAWYVYLVACIVGYQATAVTMPCSCVVSSVLSSPTPGGSGPSVKPGGPGVTLDPEQIDGDFAASILKLTEDMVPRYSTPVCGY